jgi:hypothetical protein
MAGSELADTGGTFVQQLADGLTDNWSQVGIKGVGIWHMGLRGGVRYASRVCESTA